MKNHFSLAMIMVIMLAVCKKTQSQCPHNPNGITLGTPSSTAGLDSADIIGSGSGCQVQVINSDGGEPWARYSIPIPVAGNSSLFNGATQLRIAFDVTLSSGGVGRIEVNRDNTANNAVDGGWAVTFYNNATFSKELDLPVDSGLSSVDIWLFSNYASSNPGTVTYDNFRVEVVGGGSGTDNPPSIGSFSSPSKTSTSVALQWSASDDNGITSQNISYNGSVQSVSASATGTTISELAPDTSYTFTLNVFDGTGQNDSASITVVTDADGSPPAEGTLWTQNGNNIHYNSGNVGIGTTNPGNWRLAVNGNIRAKEIKVESNWADYVFEEGYDLPTLEEVAAHIEEKGHLINIPSAAEIQADGVALGEMNKLLLEKIEELTLYILELEKRMSKVESDKK